MCKKPLRSPYYMSVPPYYNGRRPAPPSSPDRCFVLQAGSRGSSSVVPDIAFAFRSHIRAEEEFTLSTEWQESAKVSQSIGFLDLPKEIRDMVYIEVCADLKREGYRWQQTAPPPAKRVPYTEEEAPKCSLPMVHPDFKDRPTVFSDCAIMRTCRQVHAEFAEVMYSVPLQLNNVGPGINVVDFPPLYASLVRSVLVVQYMRIKDGCLDGPRWHAFLHTATSLAKVFPNATALRVGWEHGTVWLGGRPLSELPEWESQDVKTAEKTIKRIKREAYSQVIVPHQVELVQLAALTRGVSGPPNCWMEAENIVDASLAEAVRNLRAKPKKGTGTKSQKVYVW